MKQTTNAQPPSRDLITHYHGVLAPDLISIQQLLPASVSFERFVNVAAVAMASNRDLQEADGQSVINSLVMCARDGLLPDNREAALVIFKTKVKDGNKTYWVKQAQYMPMVDGLKKRVRMSGEVKIVVDGAVYSNDEFNIWLDDTGQHILHKPALGARGPMLGAYAFAVLNSGEIQYAWVNMEDIERARQASRSGSSGPWATHFVRMACKTAMKQLCRLLPSASDSDCVAAVDVVPASAPAPAVIDAPKFPRIAALENEENAGSTRASDESNENECSDQPDATSFLEAVKGARTIETLQDIRADLERARPSLPAEVVSSLVGSIANKYRCYQARDAVVTAMDALPDARSPEFSREVGVIRRLVQDKANLLGDELSDYFRTELEMLLMPELVA